MDKNIVLYCDEGYHDLALNTIKSFDRVKDKFTFHYFTIDFEPNVDRDDVIVYPIKKVEGVPHPQLMKPLILDNALNYIDEFIYVDCDLIASKHFNYDEFISNVDTYPYCPLLHETEWQRPVFFWYENGFKKELNEKYIMEYLNVSDRTQKWATTLMIGVNKTCENFITEWKDICLKKELWKPKNNRIPEDMEPFRQYFHIGDESVYNTLLWKKNVKNYFHNGAVLEPKKLKSFIELETKNIKNKRVEQDNPITDCIDSSKLYVYHQLKDLNFRENILKELGKKDSKKFLLVCSFYNNPIEHIENTFKNVLKQTHKNWILIVGDDFSDNKEFSKILKNKVKEVNDPRIIYYETKFKRELYLYQNFFKEMNYDYYFDLDSDDIIDKNILKIYDSYFRKYPEVYSIFSNYIEKDEKGNTTKYNLIKPTKDYISEFEYRIDKDVNLLWKDKSSYSMFGHGRCMRRPDEDRMEIVENVRTSTDSLFLFYNLNRGHHLHIPRNLYTYVKREGSDSSVMSKEEYNKFNLNANHYIEKYKRNIQKGELGLFDNVWFETSALSTCDFINDTNTINVISNISQENEKLIKDLYPDKEIIFNHNVLENVVVTLNKVPKDFKWKLGKTNNLTIYNYNDDYTHSEDHMFNMFDIVNNEIIRYVSEKINDFNWFTYFRHLIFSRKNIKNNDTIKITFNDGAKVEILGDSENEYYIRFFDNSKDELIYEDTIKTKMWSSPNIKYFVDWKVQVWNDDKLLKEEVLNLENKKVLIRFDSKSLGDSIAWIPYVEEFKNKHKCEVYCATFKNFLFKESYSKINFVNTNEDESNYYASYKIGWYYDKNKNPNDVRIIPLQRASSDILGLDYKEIRAKIDFTPKLKENPLGKYVTLSIQSTSQCKYWNKIDGWNKVVKYLNKHGYKVICIDQYNNFGIKNLYNHMPKNAIDFTGKPLEEILELIHHSNFHIGVSSGISWVSWALNKKTIIVSSFSNPICEFTEDCYRVYKDTEHSGYFNNIHYRFDPSNWNWNPFKEMKTLSDWDEFEPIEFKDIKVEIDKLI